MYLHDIVQCCSVYWVRPPSIGYVIKVLWQIGVLKKELESVRKHRRQYRNRRVSVPIPVVSLVRWQICTHHVKVLDLSELVNKQCIFEMLQVGYTNAGKSTLLNQLTGANFLAEDRLFATLDPTTRRVEVLSLHKNTKLFAIWNPWFIIDFPCRWKTGRSSYSQILLVSSKSYQLHWLLHSEQLHCCFLFGYY